ncbi:MAG: hypothetical protein ABIX00_05535 [Polaromonas sp.]
MRAIFGILSLLIVLAVVGMLAKKGAMTLPPISTSALPQAKSQQVQQQIKLSVESSLQQVRPMPDEP